SIESHERTSTTWRFFVPEFFLQELIALAPVCLGPKGQFLMSIAQGREGSENRTFIHRRLSQQSTNNRSRARGVTGAGPPARHYRNRDFRCSTGGCTVISGITDRKS